MGIRAEGDATSNGGSRSQTSTRGGEVGAIGSRRAFAVPEAGWRFSDMRLSAMGNVAAEPFVVRGY